MGHSAIRISQRYVHKLTECVERAMAATEEANHHNNNKVETIPGQVLAEATPRIPAKPSHSSGLQLSLAM